MTCRSAHFLRLLLALSFLPGAALADTEVKLPARVAQDESLPEIKLQPSVRATQKSTSNWQNIRPQAPTDIRFQKPNIAALNKQPKPVEPDGRYPRIVPVEPKRPVIQKTSVKRIEHQTVAPADTALIQQPKRHLARASTARLQELIEIPKPRNTAMARKPRPPAEVAADEDDDRPEIRLSDKQLQLVAQILHDSETADASDDEPLPLMPGEERAQRKVPSDFADDGTLDDGTLDDACCPPQPRLFWVAGVEATFLNPDLNSDGVTWSVEDVATTRDEIFSSQSTDVDSIYMSPRIWAGVQGCEWGANLRYWHLQASENNFDPSIGAGGAWDDVDAGFPNVGLFAANRLEAYTIDFELTRRFCINNCWMQGSVGLRHAEIEHAESLTGTALASGATLFGYAESERHTRGTGIVLGWYGRKPLAPCSSVHWYYNLRWSALWGPTQTAVETGANVVAPGANASFVNGDTTSIDDNLFIGEVQLGLEWNYELKRVPANAFVRAGIEYQRWSGGKGYSEAGSFAGVEVGNQFTTLGETFASAAAPELDLFGITFGTGLTW